MSFLKKIFLEPPYPEKDLLDIKGKFIKVCTNAHQAGKTYRKADLNKWSEEAYERGEEFFYTEPIDPSKPFGGLKLSEPNYIYELKKGLTEEEFERLFGRDE